MIELEHHTRHQYSTGSPFARLLLSSHTARITRTHHPATPAGSAKQSNTASPRMQHDVPFYQVTICLWRHRDTKLHLLTQHTYHQVKGGLFTSSLVFPFRPIFGAAEFIMLFGFLRFWFSLSSFCQRLAFGGLRSNAVMSLSGWLEGDETNGKQGTGWRWKKQHKRRRRRKA